MFETRLYKGRDYMKEKKRKEKKGKGKGKEKEKSVCLTAFRYHTYLGWGRHKLLRQCLQGQETPRWAGRKALCSRVVE